MPAFPTPTKPRSNPNHEYKGEQTRDENLDPFLLLGYCRSLYRSSQQETRQQKSKEETKVTSKNLMVVARATDGW